MNEKQKIAYDMMKNGQNIFITGGGGVGKSYLVKKFYESFSPYKKIGLTSSTGISSLLIGGTTLHSYLGIGLGNDDVSKLVYNIGKNRMIKERYFNMEILIIDEISMISPELFDKIEEIFRIIRQDERPFGGVQIIITGDFLQLPCVGNENFCFESESWKKYLSKNVVILDEIVRQKDNVFQEVLNEVRIGSISDQTKKILLSRLIKFDNNCHNIVPTILFSTNRDVDSYNNKKLEEINSKEVYEYELVWDIPKGGKKMLQDTIDKYKRNLGLSDKLELRVGAQVMVTYNLNIETGIVNGSRGIITRFNEDSIPVVKFKSGIEIAIDFHLYEVKEFDKVVITFTQLPLKLAYAITIHKSQGSTLDLVVMDLKDVFEYGQAYVALSRVKDLSSLYLKSIDFGKIVANPKALEFYGFKNN